jgi:hypothetical protein
MSLGDILGILGAFIGIAGIAVGYYLYVKTFSSIEVTCHVGNIVLLDSREGILPHQIEIFFSGRRVRSSLCQANCVIWNSGRRTIYDSDVKSDTGIAISLPQGAEILNFQVRASLPENKVTVKESRPNTISCRFDYLDRRQGFNVSIIYAGTTAIPDVRTVVAGMPKGITTSEDKARKANLFVQYCGFLSFTLLIVIVSISTSLTPSLPVGVGVAVIGTLLCFPKLFVRFYAIAPQALPPPQVGTA